MGSIHSSCSQGIRDAGDIGAGSSLGPYELLLPIARGGMASVWIARQKGRRGFQKLVALKLMHDYLSRDARFEELFLTEAEIASRVQHPNVCSISDLGEHCGRLYLAMEWVDGDTLAAIESCHLDGLPIALATRIAADVATGLHAAHELRGESGELLGVVHCDVSPQNILVTLDGVVKVADFGLARATSSARFRTQVEGFAGGKLSFMAPEQARGDLIDRRTDVFALGIVLYRLLTGRHPFQGETSEARLQRMLDPNECVRAPVAFREDCPIELSDAVMRALEKDPADRFQSMGTFARALERALPEIAKPACRDALAVLARAAVGDIVDDRRQAITTAIRVADAYAPEDELPSLPSSLLVELEDEAPPALQTSRPVAYTPLPAAMRSTRIGVFALAAAAVAMVLVGTLAASSGPAATRTLSARTPAAAEPATKRALSSRRASSATTLEVDPRQSARKIALKPPRSPRQLPAPALPAPDAASGAANEAPAAPVESSETPAWLLEPGF